MLLEKLTDCHFIYLLFPTRPAYQQARIYLFKKKKKFLKTNPSENFCNLSANKASGRTSQIN